jgi:hypothetical protein
MFEGLDQVFVGGSGIALDDRVDIKHHHIHTWVNTEDVRWLKKAVMYLLKRDMERYEEPKRKRRRRS